ncbi:LamG-like jellyroll fold domain-containing protein [Polymorphospora lycopeni]|uniref:LamG-like jellyroll fold domain-containing protein n=1 Tax=Polymorphospora lycopeni TaxID=3140240 RepID=A0ABV5D0I4_9ACTN
MSEKSLVKVYSARDYLHTTMLRHQGVTVAFAMDKDRRIHYSVLNFDPGAGRGELDAAYWHDDPAELRFPSEITQVGYAMAGATRLPTVRRGGRVEASAKDVLAAKEIDPFLSSTARLTAAAPFRVVSDGTHLVVFRQSIDAGHADAVWKLTKGGSSAAADGDFVKPNGAKVPLVDSTLLCDRFVLVGTELKPVMEVRYQRSGHRTWPASAKDTPGTKDMQGRPFYEPTQELTFVRDLTGGAFSVLLLPTEVQGSRRWQIFAVNSRTKRIDSFNVAQASSGLFDTQGARHRPTSGSAGTALQFDGTGSYVDLGNPAALQLAGKTYTLEAWINPAAHNGTILAKFDQGVQGDFIFAVEAAGHLALSQLGSPSTVQSTRPVAIGRYTHVAAVVEAGQVRLYLDGEPAGEGSLGATPGLATKVLIGAQLRNGQPGDFFSGEIDEIRIWSRARSKKELADERGRRLVGDEPGLLAYYRFDEGNGTKLHDQTGNGRDGALVGGPAWVTSKAPVDEHSGLHRSSFAFTGRDVVSGPAATLYSQQENIAPPSGPRSLVKRQARVLLAVATADSAPGGTAARPHVATLDLAVGRDGRLAQAPDQITLPVLNQPQSAADPDRISALEQLIAALKNQIKADEALVANPGTDPATVAGWDRDLVTARAEFARLEAERDLPTSWVHRIQNLQENLYVKWSTKPSSVDNRVHSTKDQSDPRTLWKLTHVNSMYGSGSYYNIRAFIPSSMAPDADGEQNVPAMLSRGPTGYVRLIAAGEAPATGTVMFDPQGISGSGTGRILAPVDNGARHLLVAFRKLTGTDYDRYGGTYALVEQTPGANADQFRWEKVKPLPEFEADLNAARLRRDDLVTKLDRERTRQALITEAEGRLRAARVELAAKEGELSRLTGGLAGTGTVSLAMPHLHTDRAGLSVTGALLGFGWTLDTPFLLDSTIGQVSLYFRGGDGQFFATYYDTEVSRAEKRLAVGTRRVRFVSRDPLIDLAGTTIEVSDGQLAQLCTVTIRNSSSSETFNSVPRQVERFADVLNGRGMAEPWHLGKVAEIRDAGKTVRLTEPLTTRVPAGAIITVAGTAVLVRLDAQRGTDTLTVVGGAGTATPGEPVTGMLYHYDLATSSRPGAWLTAGSQVVRVETDETTGNVPNGSATDLVAGRGSQWHGAIPGRAFRFDAKTHRLVLPDDRLAQVGTAGNVTVEAWVLPDALPGPGRVLNAHTQSGRYLLGLDPAPLKSALALNGVNDKVDCGPVGLVGTDFTIEFWAKRERAGRDDFVVSHGSTTQTVNSALHVGFRTDNTFTLAFWGNDLNTTATYDDLEWHHWAAVFNRATNEQLLYRDGAEVGRRSVTTPYAGVGDLRLGFSPANGSWANVRLDEVRVWGRVRTLSELVVERGHRLTGREPGLLGYWSFTGANTTDLSGNGHDGAVTGTPAVTESPLPGYQITAGKGDTLVRSRDAFPCREWAHLAATMEQSWAVSLDGRGHLDAGSDGALDVTGELTVEVFVMLDRLGWAHGLVGYGVPDDGAGGCAPYHLWVRPDGKLEFRFEEPGHKSFTYVSTTALRAATFHRVAVVRKASPPSEPDRWHDISFFIDGAPAGTHRYRGEGPKGSAGPLEFGRVRVGSLTLPLRGVLAEVRLWRVARAPDQVCRPVGPRERGLVGWWRMEENAGNVAGDATGSHPARLRGAGWTKNPDPQGSPIRLYRNGTPVLTTPVTMAANQMLVYYGYNTYQFALGGASVNNNPIHPYSGVLEEVRVWRGVRTQEQILDNAFGRIKGDLADLIACYPFDADSTSAGASEVHDAGPAGNHLLLPANQRPQVVLSTAPVSTDAAIVRPAPASVRTRFHALTDSTPSASEYADAQVDARGVPNGVMKRCYSYLRGRAWYLVTGYKVGSLVSEWVGQAQYDPQIVGYIEGAPPVPAENLTNPSTDRAPGQFNNASTVEFKQADEVSRSHGTDTENSRTAGFAATRSLGAEADINTVIAPLGAGITVPIDVAATLERKTSYDFTNTSSRQSEVSRGETTTRRLKVGLRGRWEDPGQVVNAATGPRYLPANTGFAVVRSSTADIFALRLSQTGALVSYHVTPSPDIPEDWNIISFPINPRYTKQGTLDGAVGATAHGKVLDPDYPQARDHGEYSYFKPRETYALIRRIQHERQQLRSFFEALSTEPPDFKPMLGQAALHTLKQVGTEAAGFVAGALVPGLGAIGGIAAMLGTGGHGMINPTLGELSLPGAKALVDGFSRRNLVNTYVWTAEGGFFAETTETTDAVTEATAGSFQVTKSENTGMSLSASTMGVSVGLGLDLSGGIGYTSTRSKKRESKTTFSLDVTCEPGSDLQRYKDGKPVLGGDGKPELLPGKVDAYRFVTFYLDATSENFEEFYRTIVDPIWLEQSPDRNAVALRQARQAAKKPPCWRIMHRVTYISRVLQPIPTDTTPPLEKVMRAQHIDSNYELIRKLEPYVRDATTSVSRLAEATRDALDRHLPELSPHAPEIAEYLALYYGVDR